jgi:methylenetetrahydrofolate dehydrogenase (NADP+) / methenyltetrahydrofolate cyclohydrolase
MILSGFINKLNSTYKKSNMILDGKKVADILLAELKAKIAKLKFKPGLAFILVGNNLASLTYVNMKIKACRQVGITSHVLKFANDIKQEDLIEKINEYNLDKEIHGILVQQPLPKQIDSNEIVNAILPEKDVDGFHPYNLGKLLLGQLNGFISCTPLGILTLLQYYDIPIEGKHVVILGRSNIVGKPLASLLLLKKPKHNATVTIAHSKSENLKKITLNADILVAAIGHAKFVKADMVKKGATVIDVGISKIINSDNKPQIVGDVDFDEVVNIASNITPVPKGVGPMTIAMLMQNTYKSAIQHNMLE